MRTVGINQFVLRQLDQDFGGTKLSSSQLIELKNIAEEAMMHNLDKEGYAPYCRIVTTSKVKLRTSIMPIGMLIQQDMIESGYEARQEGEIPFLCRWVDAKRYGITPPLSDHIDIILYSREQLEEDGDYPTGADYDILSINAESKNSSPMTPNTMIRNFLGSEFGGSGGKFDKEAYIKSVEFWATHVRVR